MSENSPSSSLPEQQYYLSRQAPEQVPEGRHHIEFESWHLVLDSDFSLVPIICDEERIGYIFGTVLFPEGNVGEDHLTLRAESELLSDSFERALSGILGRYVGLLNTGDEVRVYTDPIGALPAVYDQSRETIAASPLALPGMDHDERFREQLFEAVRQPLVSRGENIWLPGTITYYSGIERLLPNHYLDLGRWDQVRYWPSDRKATVNDRPGEEIESIVGSITKIFETVVDKYRNPKLSLTAGKDSRSLLAVGREFVTNGDIPLFTIGNSSWNSDVHVARRLTRAKNLEWTALPIVEATKEEQNRWLMRTGYTAGSAVQETYPTMGNLEADVELGGIGGEIGRSYLWKNSDDENTDIGPRDVLLRYHKPEHPELVATLEKWFRSVEEFDTYTTLDLAHQEHRLGCWGGPQHLGFRAHVDHIRPFTYRPVIESVHRLPPDVRRTDQLPHRIINDCWPELDDFPYNSFTNWRKYVTPLIYNVNAAKTVASNPRFAVDYLSRKYTR